VRHVSKGRILKSLGKLKDEVLKEVEDLLRELLGL
jgi:mRNA-degrading endonuclease toxin of MazEF toxin-antitoxin module